MSLKKVLFIILLFICNILVLIYLDYRDIITNLGLSVSFWSGFITGVPPIILTVYLWKLEQKERITQIKEESNFQKKLILRNTYIEYFECLLEQINEYSIFIECYLLRDKSLTGEKLDMNSRVKSIIKYVKIHSKYKVWNLHYRVYAFKCIDIDIFKYKYNGEFINLRAFMPYIDISNKLTAIYDEKEFVTSFRGMGYVNIDEKEQEELAKKLASNLDDAKELYDLLIYLKNDIEKRIAFD